MAKKKKPGGQEGSENPSAKKENLGRGDLNQQMSEKFANVTAPPQLSDPAKHKNWKLPESDDEPGPYIVELNLQHIGGLPGAENSFKDLYKQVMDAEGKASHPKQRTKKATASPAKEEEHREEARLRSKPVRISKTYYRCQMTVHEWRKLIALDETRAEALARESSPKDFMPTTGTTRRYRSIYRLWPDFPVVAHTDRSISTVKADAAFRAFDAAGRGITWAVIDSGIDANHPHFGQDDKNHLLKQQSVVDLHRCFVDLHEERNGMRIVKPALEDPDVNPDMDPIVRKSLIEAHRQAALTDDFGHGTHVAGIIAGSAPNNQKIEVCVFERQYKMDETGKSLTKNFVRRVVDESSPLRGVAPYCQLISLRILDDQGEGRSSNVIQALEYIRERINDDPKLLRVQGVNLSVGYEFDAEMFACGQSPLCTEVDRLVQAGVVVVAAAGNTGYGAVQAQARVTQLGLSNTINDPGNAALAITVGSTHRDAPHTYGVSYFSSKGPTGDGRLKPDLIAPGERITSCGAGQKLKKAKDQALATSANGKMAYYVDDSGTSMAAPHVSGAIAAFLSIRREFIGRPLEVKRIFLNSATTLGRERYFEGHGLVDLMRAIQSV